jgi:integrase
MAKVAIVLRIKEGARYPFKTAVWVGNRLKQQFCLVNGVAEHHAEGSYYLRYTERGKKKFEPATADAVDAIAFRDRRESILKARAAGLTIEEDRKPERNAVDVYEIYLAETKANKAKKTWQAYSNSLTFFRASYRGEVGQTVRTDVLDFKTFLKGQELSKRSVYNNFLNVMVFLKWAQIQHGVKKADWPPKPEREPEEFTDEELSKLLNTASATRFPQAPERLVLKCFLCSGVRSGELANLTYGDIDFEHSIWKVRAKEGAEDWDPKTQGSQREVPVPREITDMIRKRRGPRVNRDLIFYNRDGGVNHHLLRIVKRVAKRAGLTDIRVDDHKFRSTAITKWLREGNSVQDIMVWVGHKDLKTILRYAAKVNMRKEVRMEPSPNVCF